MIIENESEEIGRMADENKVVPLETLVINKEEFEQLFLDFFVQYDRIYDFLKMKVRKLEEWLMKIKLFRLKH